MLENASENENLNLEKDVHNRAWKLAEHICIGLISKKRRKYIDLRAS
jgi:hypothetical protein